MVTVGSTKLFHHEFEKPAFSTPLFMKKGKDPLREVACGKSIWRIANPIEFVDVPDAMTLVIPGPVCRYGDIEGKYIRFHINWGRENTVIDATTPNTFAAFAIRRTDGGPIIYSTLSYLTAASYGAQHFTYWHPVGTNMYYEHGQGNWITDSYVRLNWTAPYVIDASNVINNGPDTELRWGLYLRDVRPDPGRTIKIGLAEITEYEWL